jgi:hypothetical protein
MGLWNILVRGTLLAISFLPEHKAFCLLNGQFRE